MGILKNLNGNPIIQRGVLVDLHSSREAIKPAERILPQSKECEQSLLGCCLLDPAQCIPQCLVRFGDSNDICYDLRHQEIWKAIKGIYNQGKRPDLISVQQTLKDAGSLENVGGIPYLSSLEDCVPSVANLGYYLDIAMEKYILRRLLDKCGEISERIFNHEGDVENLIGECEREILEVTKISITRDNEGNEHDILELIEDYDTAARDHRPMGMSSGLRDLDWLLGGMVNQEVIVVAGNTSSGKSSLCLNILEHNLDQGFPCGIISTEMSRKEYLHRLACTKANVEGRKAKNGTLSEEEMYRLIQAVSEVKKLPVIINDEGSLTLIKLCAKARRMVQQFKIKILLVDYLQHIHASSRITDMRTDVTLVSNGIKQLAKELNIPIILVSQLNREASKENRPPRLFDLRESGAIEQDADAVVFVHPESEVEENLFQMSAIVAKRRAGGTGTRTLMFNRKITKFYCMEEEK